jgi:hypothetical protein
MRPSQRPDLFLPVSVRALIGFVVDSPSWSAFDELQSVGQRLITSLGCALIYTCVSVSQPGAPSAGRSAPLMKAVDIATANKGVSGTD